MRAISLAFHDVADGPPQTVSAAVYAIDRETFEAHLCAIEKERRFVSAMRQRAQWDMDRPIFLTFDDGRFGNYVSAAPALEQHRWHGHFFITTDWIGNPGYMNSGQIQELHNRGHVIGSHSSSHPERMSALSEEKLLREWRDSCAALSSIIGQPIRVASVAGGYYSRKVAKAAAQAGVEVLFTSEPTCEASLVDGCLVLGRYSIQRHTAPDVCGRIAAGQIVERWRQTSLWKAKKILKLLAGDTYITLRRRFFSRRLMGQRAIR